MAALQSKGSSSVSFNNVVTAPELSYRSNDTGNIPWYSYAWDSFGKPQEERNFVVKLDLSLLVFSVLGLLMRYIDQKNVDSAYVSGMREELNLYGNELNYAQTCWTVGYVIGQVPVNMLLNRISPHYIIFALEMGWTLLTLCTTWAHHATHLYVIRFFVGLFESGYYPGLLFLIGSWYTKDELAKRSNIFQAATAGGTLLCGLIQGGIYSSLNGKGGYSGWRWCFAIDALISFPIAVGAFFMIPDLPTVIKPNWLFSERDIEIGKARMIAAGREGPKPGSFNFKFFVNLLSEWHIWLFTAGYSLYIYSQNPQQSMSFWLKYSKNPTYTVPQINYYPSGIWATQIVSALGFLWLSDTILKGWRWPPLIFVTVRHLIDVAVLAGTPVYAENRVPRWVFYYLSGLVNCTPGLFYAWCSEIVGASSEKRGVIMGTFNSVAYSFNAWLPLLLFKTTEQPRVLKGNISVVVAQALLIGVLLAILHLSMRDQKREAKKAQDD
ncbi:major facilitator superfamily domain-containing protein [Desarmillaria tabescens]|uniref:Major facilitator superfamily domain-containing protein n=1 Tax=Armillaria tabescens TaxID=1929756 RepID=A0AA39KD76_ARMTA|nr:major facilitator superfamily domain-containing protein [Desarmillaria tabescens]KAK0457706.1 major facilitator superfamily domain-containing protein [Desarmillaria tabescens]